MQFNQLKKYFSLGPLLIVMAAVLWALDGILRRSLYTLPPITIVFLEHLLGSVLLVPIVWKGYEAKKMTSQVWGLLLFVSLLSGLLGTLWFTTALIKTSYIPFSVVFLLQKLQPLFAISTAAVFLKEKISKDYLPWAVIALLAGYFVTFPNGMINMQTGGETVLAALFAFGAAAAWGSATTFSRMILQKISDSQALGWRFMITTVLAGIGLFVFNAQASLSQVTLAQIAMLLVIALSTGMVALWVYYRGLARTEAKIATILELAFPLLAVFIDMVMYKTFLQPGQYLAATVLFYAMYHVGKLGLATSQNQK